MLDLLSRHVVQPLVAAKRRSRHLDYLRLLERTQFDPPEAIRARQLAMLKGVLRHAFATVPFYQRAWAAAGVHPEDVRSLDDLRHFPVVTKTDLRKHEAEFHSTAVDISQARVKRTSGSTGVPLTIRLDERGAQWKTACTLRGDQWSGWRLGQRVAKVWGNPEYRHHGLRGRLTNALVDRAVYLDTLPLTDDRITEFVRTVRRHRPGLIFGHAHSLYLVACKLRAMGVADVRPNGVIATAMPLHGFQRAVIEQVFGVPATDRYGCEEVSLIACQCERHGGLHVTAESIYTEIEPTGHLLVTDLSNAAMPLIRYRIGDVVTPSAGPCPCGRGLPTFAKVEGRDADYVLTPAGGLISGISLTENFALLVPGAAQVQLVQESLTFLRVRLVPDDRFTDAGRKSVADLVRDTFGPAMRHEVELVAGIPQEPSGKYRFCVSKPAQEYLRSLSA
ncbi:MAG: phenylacetate--CoA ligase family protein [Gemmataceae bacterium]